MYMIKAALDFDDRALAKKALNKKDFIFLILVLCNSH